MGQEVRLSSMKGYAPRHTCRLVVKPGPDSARPNSELFHSLEGRSQDGTYCFSLCSILFESLHGYRAEKKGELLKTFALAGLQL